MHGRSPYDFSHPLTPWGGMKDAIIRKKRLEGEREILLRLLEDVEREMISSRKNGFAKRVGIAKGLANAYFNRCLQKGWIRLQQIPKQRFLYYLTPTGFAEKASLTAEFLTSSYRFYRTARAEIGNLMVEAARGGHRRLAVLGDGELAEIIAIVSEESQVEIAGFIAPKSTRKQIVGRPVVSRWSEISEADGAILAALDKAQTVYDDFRVECPHVNIFVPRHLNALLRKAYR